MVRGQEMREVERQQRFEKLLWTYAWMIAAIVALGIGYQAWRTRREWIASKSQPQLEPMK